MKLEGCREVASWGAVVYIKNKKKAGDSRGRALITHVVRVDSHFWV